SLRSRRFSLSRMRMRSSRCSISAFSASTSLGSSRTLVIISRLRTDVIDEVAPHLASFQVNPFEDHRQLRAIDLDLWTTTVKPLERAALEPLVEQPEAVAVPHQQLHAIAAAVEEEEQVACEGIGAEAIAHDLHQAVEALAEVDRLARREDPDARRQAQHRSIAVTKRVRAPVSIAASMITRRSP